MRAPAKIKIRNTATMAMSSFRIACAATYGHISEDPLSLSLRTAPYSSSMVATPATADTKPARAAENMLKEHIKENITANMLGT